jgi:hypothetical protein
MLTPISLLSIMITLSGGQTVPPQDCICYNPLVLNTTDDPDYNSTVPCTGAGCSRANNPVCYVDYDDYLVIIFYRRAFLAGFTNDIPFDAGFLGCNCPGFSYNATAGPNGYFYAPPNSDSNGDDVIFNNCSFGDEFDVITDCCNYCCNPPYVPGAGSSIYSFYSLFISILFPLAFIYIKMIKPDTNKSKFNTHRPNPGD